MKKHRNTEPFFKCSHPVKEAKELLIVHICFASLPGSLSPKKRPKTLLTLHVQIKYICVSFAFYLSACQHDLTFIQSLFQYYGKQVIFQFNE